MCIVHINTYDKDPGTLVAFKDYNSWLTLLDDAKVRKHKPILQIAESLHEREMPKIQYHRQCRRRFTLDKELKKLTRKSEEREDGDPSSSGTAK